MPSIAGVFGRPTSTSGSETVPATRNRMASGSMSAIADVQELESAMWGVSFIMEDDLENAEDLLEKGSSPYHKLGIGVVWFMKAVLGFEHDVMRGATDKLGIAESSANEWRRRSQKDTRTFRSDIYPPGSEYAMCNAEAQIMSALVGILTESLTEAVKGFYKVKKAISTLDGIEDAEANYMKTKSVSSLESSDSDDEQNKSNTYPQTNGHPASAANKNGASSSREPDVYEDACEAHLSRVPTLRYLGHIESEGIIHDLRDLHHAPKSAIHDPTTKSNATKTLIPASEFRSPIELFIAGAHALHHGMLLLMLSLVPPTFGKLLSIVGFRGDRERGLQLLWRGTTFDGINGGTSAMLLLGYYTNIISLLDIVPPSAYPREDCMNLLIRMRKKYPNSRMWRLHESRIHAADHYLEEAAGVLSSTKSPLQQIESLRWFEYGLTSMFLHRYEECARAFLKCIELNTWSHALYYYVAGVCHVELYRSYAYGDFSKTNSKQVNGDSKNLTNEDSNSEKAQYHANQAEELLDKVIGCTNKKRGWLSRQPPFDVFVARKITKWSTIAQQSNIPLVEAVSISPCEELIFFFGGFKRMSEVELHQSLTRLRFSDAGEAEDSDIASTPPIPQPLISSPLLDDARTLPVNGMDDTNGTNGTNGTNCTNGVNGHSTPNDHRATESTKPLAPLPASWLNSPEPIQHTDDAATLAVLRAAIYRNFPDGKNVHAARQLLEDEVIDKYNWADFKLARGTSASTSESSVNGSPTAESPTGGNSTAIKFRDLWPLPCARYELGVCCWIEAGRPEPRPRHEDPGQSDAVNGTKYDEPRKLDIKKLKECAALLEEIANWETFDLDTRIGMKISAGRETMRAILG